MANWNSCMDSRIVNRSKLTSLEVSKAGKELSNPDSSSSLPFDMKLPLPPPNKSSSAASSTVARLSLAEVNRSASSPRAARSRSRKLAASVEAAVGARMSV